MKNNNRFANRTTNKNIDNFYKIMSGEKKIITKKDISEFEASYFAMCLLLPKDAFSQVIEFLGGMETVKSDPYKKESLARIFNVEHRLVEARINSIISQDKQQEKNNRKVKFKKKEKK